jgi:hypothetical protein
MTSGTSNGCAICRPALGQQGQHLLPQETAISSSITVGGVRYKRQIMPTGVSLNMFTTNAQQGAAELTSTQFTLLRHPRETFNACASHQAQEESLNLVIEVVSKEQYVTRLQICREHPVTSLPSVGLAAGCRHLNRASDQGYLQLITDVSTMLLPPVRFTLQTMIYMQCKQRRGTRVHRAPVLQEVQQNRGIGTAAIPNEPVWRLGQLRQRDVKFT